MAKTAVVVDTGSINSSYDYCWLGADEGIDYTFGHEAGGPAASDATLVNTAPVNLNTSVSSYVAPCLTVACSHSNSHVPKLPRALNLLFTKGIDASIPASIVRNMILTVAYMGATHHMCPERSALIFYHPVTNISISMGNKSLAPVLGKRTTIISLNSKLVFVYNITHVPTLCTPLYSLFKYLTQRGCRFLRDESLGGGVHLISHFCPSY